MKALALLQGGWQHKGGFELDAIVVIDSDVQKRTCIKSILEFIDIGEVCLTDPDNWQHAGVSPEALGACIVSAVDLGRHEKLLEEIKNWAPEVPILLLRDDPVRGKAGQSMPPQVLGQVKFPIKYKELTGALQQAEIYRESRNPEGESHSPELFRSLVGSSRSIQRVRKLIDQVADTGATVLILGDSGTGKEVVARNVHYHSSRRNKAFVPVNCGAIPSELLESELFGHEKGAFTGAISARQGRFEMAEGGTLFLDEIGDMDLQMQVKLLRVLQEKTFERVGSNKTIHANVRIIAATHRDLDKAIETGDFREDLYYRLNVFPIDMPPLRERTEDIPLLIKEIILRLQHEKRGTVSLTQSAVMALCQHHWAGNVRELANVIERLVIMHPYGVVDMRDLPEKYQVESGSEGQEAMIPDPTMITLDQFEIPRLPRTGIDLKEHLTNLECNLIRQALDDAEGVVAHAANKLHLRRTTLVEKLRKYGIQRADEVT